ncbi:MAG: phospho-N-acetylmuramoyl-pentapeptide-transferase, partial [Verrucomicrobia bacterium]|nr:phospho-N-acetylmuramoyl-pentapeptide-transferase [Verrucomicrobiota bacterium]
MFYFLHHLTRLDEAFGPFNIFRYANFRAVMAAVTAMLLSIWLGPRIIAWLQSLKMREEVGGDADLAKLAALRKGKSEIPSMGGILIVFAISASALLWCNPQVKFVWVVLFCLLWLAVLGWHDDYQKAIRKQRQGLSVRQKLAGQIALGLLVAVWMWFDPDTSRLVRELWVPFVKRPLATDIGLIAAALIVLIIVASANAVNLTDGLDGLAIGCTITAGGALGILAYI